jgi:hypothetical protein
MQVALATVADLCRAVINFQKMLTEEALVAADKVHEKQHPAEDSIYIASSTLYKWFLCSYGTTNTTSGEMVYLFSRTSRSHDAVPLVPHYSKPGRRLGFKWGNEGQVIDT